MIPATLNPWSTCGRRHLINRSSGCSIRQPLGGGREITLIGRREITEMYEWPSLPSAKGGMVSSITQKGGRVLSVRLNLDVVSLPVVLPSAILCFG